VLHGGVAALIPRRAGDHVKTNRRDSERLASLARAGELEAIHVPARHIYIQIRMASRAQARFHRSQDFFGLVAVEQP
jgi:hypothetical protein